MSISLRPLTQGNIEENFEEYLSLKISDEQMNHSLLGTMEEIFDQMMKIEDITMSNIYNEEEIVGFIAYSPTKGTADYHIRRFLIDERHQRHGYGTSALQLVIAELREKPDCERVTVSYMFFNEWAAIYEKLGFIEEPIGDDEPGECFAVLTLGQ